MAAMADLTVTYRATGFWRVRLAAFISAQLVRAAEWLMVLSVNSVRVRVSPALPTPQHLCPVCGWNRIDADGCPMNPCYRCGLGLW